MMYLKLFMIFFKVGAFTFGGGYAMIALIQKEVLSQGWMNLKELLNFIAIAESTPGPIAVNMSTFIGTRQLGISGGLVATLAIVLPSFVIILVIAKSFDCYKNSKYIKIIMKGLKPCVIGLILASIISLSDTAFFNHQMTLNVIYDFKLWIKIVLFILLVYLTKKKIHPILLIILSAIVGIGINMIL